MGKKNKIMLDISLESTYSSIYVNSLQFQVSQTAFVNAPSNFTGCATSYMKCTKLIALNFTQNGNAKFEKRGKLCKFRKKIALILGNLLQKGRRRYEDMRKKGKKKRG